VPWRVTPGAGGEGRTAQARCGSPSRPASPHHRAALASARNTGEGGKGAGGRSNPAARVTTHHQWTHTPTTRNGTRVHAPHARAWSEQPLQGAAAECPHARLLASPQPASVRADAARAAWQAQLHRSQARPRQCSHRSQRRRRLARHRQTHLPTTPDTDTPPVGQRTPRTCGRGRGGRAMAHRVYRLHAGGSVRGESEESPSQSPPTGRSWRATVPEAHRENKTAKKEGKVEAQPAVL